MEYGGRPDVSPPDLVRAYVGDTGDVPLLDDATYIAFLALTKDHAGRAAVLAATAIAAKFAQEPDRAIDGIRISYAPSAKSYADLARILRNDPLVGGGFVAPLAGGISDPATGLDLPNLFTRSRP